MEDRRLARSSNVLQALRTPALLAEARAVEVDTSIRRLYAQVLDENRKALA